MLKLWSVTWTSKLGYTCIEWMGLQKWDFYQYHRYWYFEVWTQAIVIQATCGCYMLAATRIHCICGLVQCDAVRCSAVQMRMRVNGSEQIGWLAGWHTHHSLEPILPMMLPRVHLYFTTCIHLQKKGASCLSIKIHHHLVYTTNWNLISDIRYSNNQIWCRVIGYSLTRPLKHISEPPWKKIACVGGLVGSPFECCSLHQIKEAVFRLLNGCCDQDRSSQGTNLVGWIEHCALQCETRYSIW